MSPRLKTKILKYLVLFLALGSALVWFAVFKVEANNNLLLVHFFDVGQGDAIFIEAPNGSQVLIDGGPDNSVLAKLGSVMPFWDHTIDLVILTHPHADHLDGLIEILKRYSVATVLETDVNHSIPEYYQWHTLLKDKGVKVVIAKTGQRIKLSGSVYFDIFEPSRDFVGQSPKNIHDAMVVSKLYYASTTVLFMGDAEQPLERQLLSGGADLKADVLKVGHHGSKTSSSEEFLKAVSPSVAVISVGKKNRYGHPHQVVLDRLSSLGIGVFRTDRDGDITVTSDGRQFSLKTEN